MPRNDPVIIGVDVGGTNIEAAAVRGGKVLASKKKQTRAERGTEVVIGRIEATILGAIDKMDGKSSDIESVCVGAPGAVDSASGVVVSAPNLGWTDVALGEELEKRLKRPVLVENDVNVGVVGEHVYGAGKGALDMVGIFVGTGVGGGLVVNGEPYDGFRGAAGEIGHMVIDPQGRKCPCGRNGCVEAYASKTAMREMIREQLARGRKSIVPDLIEEKGKDRLTSGVIEAALDAGDAPMEEALRTAQYYLGLLSANLVNSFDPEVIVYGGGLVERLGKSFLKPIARTARAHYFQKRHARRIRIVPAALGDDAGPIGAAVVAERRPKPS